MIIELMIRVEIMWRRELTHARIVDHLPGHIVTTRVRSLS